MPQMEASVFHEQIIFFCCVRAPGERVRAQLAEIEKVWQKKWGGGLYFQFWLLNSFTK